jgi:GTP cyclohydrolase II
LVIAWSVNEKERVRVSNSIANFGSADQIAAERAIAEFRAGRGVVIRDQLQRALAVAGEAVDTSTANWLDDFADGTARLVLTASRLRRIGVDRRGAGSIALRRVQAQRIEQLVARPGARLDGRVSPASALEEASLELTRLALILPATVVIPLSEVNVHPFLEVAAGTLRNYRQQALSDLSVVGRAPVPLDGAPDTEFVVFRGGEGMRDQIAIIVGKPNLAETVTVRLHSACLTGDLFGSLKCDCGDQLRGTVRFMAENDGGILLYLDQEGRGNGIANKIRAYQLQARGFDTYDADEVLGFEHDQRRFDFAAKMLKKLGVARVRVMTNNPMKIAALEAAGLAVVATERILGRATDENVGYLASKRDRAGHDIDFDAPTHVRVSD